MSQAIEGPCECSGPHFHSVVHDCCERLAAVEKYARRCAMLRMEPSTKGLRDALNVSDPPLSAGRDETAEKLPAADHAAVLSAVPPTETVTERRLREEVAFWKARCEVLAATVVDSPLIQPGVVCGALGPDGATCRLIYGHSPHINHPHIWTDAWRDHPNQNSEPTDCLFPGPYTEEQIRATFERLGDETNQDDFMHNIRYGGPDWSAGGAAGGTEPPAEVCTCTEPRNTPGAHFAYCAITVAAADHDVSDQLKLAADQINRLRAENTRLAAEVDRQLQRAEDIHADRMRWAERWDDKKAECAALKARLDAAAAEVSEDLIRRRDAVVGNRPYDQGIRMGLGIAAEAVRAALSGGSEGDGNGAA